MALSRITRPKVNQRVYRKTKRKIRARKNHPKAANSCRALPNIFVLWRLLKLNANILDVGWVLRYAPSPRLRQEEHNR